MKSIRKQMLVYLMIGALILFGMLILATNIILKDLPTQTKEQYSEIVNARADEVSKELQGFVDQINMISNSSITRTMDLEQIKEYLPNILLDGKHRNMTIAYPDGRGWSTSIDELDISNQEQYKEIFINGKDGIISQPFINPYSKGGKEAIVTIAHSVKDDNNKTIGLVNIVIKVDFLNNIVRQIDLKGHGYSWIVNKNGDVVAHSNPKTIMSKNIKDYIHNDEDTVERISEMGSGVIEYKDENDVKLLAFFHRIKGSPDWTFIISIEEMEIYREINGLKNAMLLSIVIGLISLVIFSIYYSRTLTEPILSLKETFIEAANGNLNVKANEKIPNELGLAAKSFNTMLEQIKDLTYKDSITDLYNYNGFLLELSSKMEASPVKDTIAAIVIVSIDDFKRINTIKGYKFGDSVLYNLAQNINNFINHGEIIARFLGDEFILFLQGKEEEELKDRIIDLRKLCNREIEIMDYQFVLKTSIGASVARKADITIDEIIHQATVAKLIVKKTGGDNCRFYNYELDQFIIEEQKIENDLYHSIENNELKLVYQPIIEVSNNKVETVEALLRWTNPLYKTMSPLVMIAIAEQSSLILEIGQWVLKQACMQNKTWQNKGYPPVVVSVNVSAIQLEQRNFVEMITEILQETKLEPKYLELEITESSAMDGVEEKLIKIQQLKDMGIRISIDDFGTGYSSLSYFTQLPIDTLKIDRSFIMNMLKDENSKIIINTIIYMAKSIQVDITAEGVETKEQLEYLKQRGCDKIQGYYYSRPVDHLDIEEMLDKEMDC